MVPFMDTEQMDSASIYHSFDVVTVDYIPEGGVFLEPKLSKIEFMVGRYLMKRHYKPGIGLGKLGNDILAHFDKRLRFHF